MKDHMNASLDMISVLFFNIDILLVVFVYIECVDKDLNKQVIY